MGYLCDFCGDQRSMVYCRSDAACLCLSCDRNVHSANILSKRHSRTLLCERCHTQPAIVRCWEERVSLCQNCDWLGHSGSSTSTTSSHHKRQTISCYSGCPSAAELSSLWSFVLDVVSAGESACEQEMGLMSINENDNAAQSDEDGLSASIRPTSPSSLPEPQVLDQKPPESTNPNLPKLSFGGTKGEGVFGNEELYADLDMDEVDLNFENYEELFGMALHNSEELFENGGIDSLFGTTDMSGADSNCQGGAVGAEGSAGLLKAMAGCSNAASADSAMSTKTEPIVCCFVRPAHGSVSLSGDAIGPEDCGVSSSSMLLMAGEPPWCPPNQDNSLQFANRNDAVMRYKEKKKMRKFEKRVRYASRKARADVRKRVKGRFVKAGDAYDYDPLIQTRSY